MWWFMKRNANIWILHKNKLSSTFNFHLISYWYEKFVWGAGIIKMKKIRTQTFLNILQWFSLELLILFLFIKWFLPFFWFWCCGTQIKISSVTYKAWIYKVKIFPVPDDVEIQIYHKIRLFSFFRHLHHFYMFEEYLFFFNSEEWDQRKKTSTYIVFWWVYFWSFFDWKSNDIMKVYFRWDKR